MKEILFDDGENITLEIKSIAASGSGVGIILLNGFNRPVFVPQTVPGDVVLVKIRRNYKRKIGY